MKKLILLLIVVVAFAAILSVIVTLIPCFSYTHQLSDFGVSIKIPGTYEENEVTNDSLLLSFIQNKKGILISAVDLGKDFWNGNTAEERMEEYLKVISAANYDASIENIKKEVLPIADSFIGKVEYDNKRGSIVLKTIALLTEQKNGNLAIEIYGTQEAMVENKEEIEKIMSSIKIGKNKHEYSDKEIYESGNELKNGENLFSGEQLGSGEQLENGKQLESGDNS